MTQPKPMARDEKQTEKRDAKSCAASSGTSCAKYTAPCAPHRPGRPPLDKLRSINAIAESFFQLLKRERTRRRTYRTRDAARQDVFEDIEMFYTPKREHTNNGMLSPVDFEIRQQNLKEADARETRGTSGTQTRNLSCPARVS